MLNVLKKNWASAMHTAELSYHIRQIQINHKDLYLCGSAALILKGVLPNREIHDLDFVSCNRDLIKEFALWPDVYTEVGNRDEYVSYSGFTQYSNIKVNILLYKKNTEFNLDTVQSNYGNIICQNVDDIVEWKKKYNRQKDLIDLDNIAANMLEKAIFTK
jgi:hypothetical protein